jgi:hypothetical protein
LLKHGEGLGAHLCGPFLVLLDALCAVFLLQDLVLFLDLFNLSLSAGDDSLDFGFNAFESVFGDLLFFLFLPLLSALLFLLRPEFLVFLQGFFVVFLQLALVFLKLFFLVQKIHYRLVLLLFGVYQLLDML